MTNNTTKTPAITPIFKLPYDVKERLTIEKLVVEDGIIKIPKTIGENLYFKPMPPY